MRTAETYEERADQAEYQVDLLEGMLYSFFRESKHLKDEEIPSLAKLRQAWKEYREFSS